MFHQPTKWTLQKSSFVYSNRTLTRKLDDMNLKRQTQIYGHMVVARALQVCTTCNSTKFTASLFFNDYYNYTQNVVIQNAYLGSYPKHHQHKYPCSHYDYPGSHNDYTGSYVDYPGSQNDYLLTTIWSAWLPWLTTWVVIMTNVWLPCDYHEITTW